MNILKNALGFSHEMIEKYVSAGDLVIDATVGNGNDTVFLAELVGDKGHVYGFDIQESAIENTRLKLEKENLDKRVTLIKDGHENLDKYIDKEIKAGIFNLGYLPGGDHKIHTNPDTTISSIEKLLCLLMFRGIIMIVIYSGGDTGFEEKDAVIEFIKNLDNKKYSALVYKFINQINNPPIGVCIQKIK